MMRLALLLTCLIGSMTTDSFASTDASGVPRCLSLTAEQRQQIGIRCHAQTGAVFERVLRPGFGEAWRAPNGWFYKGWIWSDIIGVYNHYDAQEKCEQMGAILPSRGDYRKAMGQGYSAIVPHMGDAETSIWTSDVHHEIDVYAWYTRGYSFLEFANRYTRLLVRCIARE